LPESPALKDQPIVAAQDGSPNRAERPEALEAGRFDGPLRLLRPTAKRNPYPMTSRS
jgi:hypothetical protein